MPKEVNGAEQFWINMPFEERKALLRRGSFWEGVNTYLWIYLPKDIREFIEEEYQKSCDESTS